MKSWALDILAYILAWLILTAVACGAEHPAVVRIVATDCNGSMCERSYGSGTLVGIDGDHGIIITCAHVFCDNPSSIVVRFGNGADHQARLVRVDTTWDLAALVVAKPTVVPLPIAVVFPKPGDRLFAGGYGHDGRLAWQRGRAIGYKRPQTSDRHEWLELSGAARDGDSGGPVINERGELAAVLWGTDHRVICGAYCGRVQAFLRTCFPRWGQRPSRPPCMPIRPPPATPPVRPTQPDCVTQEQFQVLVTRVDDMEVAMGKLVAIAPAIPEDPLPGPGDMPPLPDGTEPITVPPPVVDHTGDLIEIRKQLQILLARIDALEPPDIDDLTKQVIARMPPITLRSADLPGEGTTEYWSAQIKPGDNVRLPGIEVHRVDKQSGTVVSKQKVHLADVLSIHETPGVTVSPK